MLPGMSAGFDNLFSQLTVVDSISNGGVGNTIDIPEDAVVGDIIFLVDLAATEAPDDTPPTGFDELIVFSGDGTGAPVGTGDGSLSYRIIQAGDAGDTITSENAAAVMMLLHCRGDAIITAAVVQDINFQLTNGDPTAQVKEANGGNVPLVVLGVYRGTTVDPRTFSTTADGEESVDHANFDAYLKWKIYNSAPADTTIDMDDEGSLNMLASCYVELS